MHHQIHDGRLSRLVYDLAFCALQILNIKSDVPPAKRIEKIDKHDKYSSKTLYVIARLRLAK